MHLTCKYHSIVWKSGLNKTGESELRTHIYYHLLHDFGCNITICLKFLLPNLTQNDRRYPQVASQNKLHFLSCLCQVSDDRNEHRNYYMKPQQKVIAQHMLSFFALIFQNQFLGEDSSRCWHCYSYILLKIPTVGQLSWQSACPAYTKPQVQSPALRKPEWCHTPIISALKLWMQEDGKSEVMLSYIESYKHPGIHETLTQTHKNKTGGRTYLFGLLILCVLVPSCHAV